MSVKRVASLKCPSVRLKWRPDNAEQIDRLEQGMVYSRRSAKIRLFHDGPSEVITNRQNRAQYRGSRVTTVVGLIACA